MIALASDCMLFQLSTGVKVPLSADMVSVEVGCAREGGAEQEYLDEATGAVFYYFKYELGRQSVTLAEFSEALEKVMQGFAVSAGRRRRVIDSDLCQLLGDWSTVSELAFFPRLRDELRCRLREEPRTLRLRGLRRCVKQLAGASRWSARCESLRQELVLFVRQCIWAEAGKTGVSVVME